MLGGMTPRTARFDRVCAELAESQYGLLGHDQIVTSGIPEHFIEYRLRTKRWERLQPVVYRVAGSPHSLEQDILAACLSAGPEAVASCRSAAWLWRLDGPFHGHVECSMPRLRKHRPHGAFVHRSSDLVPEHATLRFGIPVTKPARTLVDLGAVVRQPVLDRAVDDALAKRLVSVEGLLAMLEEVGRKGRRGVGPLRASLADRTDVPSTVLEAAFQRLVRRFGLPEPLYQYEVRGPGGRFVARVDAAYPELGVVIELDGAATRVGREALAYDVVRQNRIIECGLVPWRFVWRQVIGAPEKLAADLERLIDRRRNELGLQTRACS